MLRNFAKFRRKQYDHGSASFKGIGSSKKQICLNLGSFVWFNSFDNQFGYKLLSWNYATILKTTRHRLVLV